MRLVLTPHGHFVATKEWRFDRASISDPRNHVHGSKSRVLSGTKDRRFQGAKSGSTNDGATVSPAAKKPDRAASRALCPETRNHPLSLQGATSDEVFVGKRSSSNKTLVRSIDHEQYGSDFLASLSSPHIQRASSRVEFQKD